MWKTIKWIIGIILVLGIVGSLIDKFNSNGKPINTAAKFHTEMKEQLNKAELKLTSAQLLAKSKKLIQENNPNAAIDTLQMINSKSKEYAEAQKLLKHELFINAKKLLKEKPKYSNDDNSGTYLWQAASNLEFIEKGDEEYSEAQKLLKQIHAKQKIILKKEKSEIEKRMAEERKEYARKLEFTFLDKLHMDTTVTVSGKNNTIIKIKWILWSRVSVYEFLKDGRIIDAWRSMGFKKYILTDGYRLTWSGII